MIFIKFLSALSFIATNLFKDLSFSSYTFNYRCIIMTPINFCVKHFFHPSILPFLVVGLNPSINLKNLIFLSMPCRIKSTKNFFTNFPYTDLQLLTFISPEPTLQIYPHPPDKTCRTPTILQPFTTHYSLLTTHHSPTPNPQPPTVLALFSSPLALSEPSTNYSRNPISLTTSLSIPNEYTLRIYHLLQKQTMGRG